MCAKRQRPNYVQFVSGVGHHLPNDKDMQPALCTRVCVWALLNYLVCVSLPLHQRAAVSTVITIPQHIVY